MAPRAASTSALRTSSGFGMMVPVSRSLVLKSAGQPRRTCLGVSAISRHTTQRADLLLLCFPLVGLRPTVAQRLSVRQVAAGQGRHGPAVPQLRRSRVYGPEEAETRARQARVSALAWHHLSMTCSGVSGPSRQTRQVAALLALLGRLTAYSVQVAA